MKYKLIAYILLPVVILLKNLRILSSIAVRLTAITKKSSFPVHPKHLISEMKWYLKDLKKTDTVLDLGSNDGSNSLAAAKICRMVIGIDHSEKLLAIARQRAVEKQLTNVTFSFFDIEKTLPFENESFDAILFLDVLEHINNQKVSMNEVWRLLKPGGKLFLSLPNNNSSWKRLQRFVGVNSFTDPDHKREYDLPSIEALLRNHKLKLSKIEPVTFDTPIAPIFDFIGGLSIVIYKHLLRLKKLAVKRWPDETIGYQLVAIKYHKA